MFQNMISDRLEIRTVARGFYEGFNPVVAVSCKLIIVAIVVILILMPETSRQALDTIKSFTLTVFAGWYIYLLAAILLFCVTLVFLPISGRIKLGPNDALPEFSTPSWLAMMFCAGIGNSMLAFAVSEPVSHFLTNPDQLAATTDMSDGARVASAMRFTYLHYGFSAWATYALAGLTLGLACHRFGQPITIRSGLVALFGKRLDGAAGHFIDIISVLAIVAGISTSTIIGIEQICAGLSLLTGNSFFVDNVGNPPLIALLIALFVATAVAIASVVSGVNRGVKWVSQIGLFLTFVVLAVFLIFGGGLQVGSVLTDGLAAYLKNLFSQTTTLYDANASQTAQLQRGWQSEWTVFYWAWWIAYAPFIGTFFARISRGRTIREFVLGSMIAPALMCFVWFASTGGTALGLELDGTAQGAILGSEHAFRIYQTIDIMLAPSFALGLKAIIVLLFLILIVASTTAAVIAIKSIGAAGSELAETPMHSIIWALAIAANAGAVVAVGGVDSIRDVMIFNAVPFSLILALMMVSCVIMIVAAARRAPNPAIAS